MRQRRNSDRHPDCWIQDGQEICKGEVLHFLDSSYFFYEGGHTLRFQEKTIRLASIVPEEEPIIANAGNAWFQPLTGEL